MDPLSLDWGAATAEFQNDEAKSAVHLFAHDLTTPERAERSLRYAQGKLGWCGRKMAGYAQEIWYDEREQKVATGAREKIKAALQGRVAGLQFMSEGEA